MPLTSKHRTDPPRATQNKARSPNPKPTRRVRAISVMADDARGIVVNGDVEDIRHTVVNTVLDNISKAGPAGLVDAIDWVAPRIATEPGTTWVAVRNLAYHEAMSRFSRLGPAVNAWKTAVRLRALARVLDRIHDRMLIDVGWVRAQLGRGAPILELKAELIQRHSGLLMNEIQTVWPMLERYYDRADQADPHYRPTRGEFESGTPEALREHDRKNRPAPLSDRHQEGFPRP
ncbi:MAG: hypothetical protein ACI9OJ_005703 [Myxococcota bacterium]|jgi:hypothetical protein